MGTPCAFCHQECIDFIEKQQNRDSVLPILPTYCKGKIYIHSCTYQFDAYSLSTHRGCQVLGGLGAGDTKAALDIVLPSRCLTSSEGHRQVNRPLHLGSSVCEEEMHARGTQPGSFTPGVEESVMKGVGGDKATGEMGFSSEERGEGESFPGRGKACAKVQEAGVEGRLYSWNRASRQEGQEETEKASRGPDHKVFGKLQ